MFLSAWISFKAGFGNTFTSRLKVSRLEVSYILFFKWNYSYIIQPNPFTPFPDAAFFDALRHKRSVAKIWHEYVFEKQQHRRFHSGASYTEISGCGDEHFFQGCHSFVLFVQNQDKIRPNTTQFILKSSSLCFYIGLYYVPHWYWQF
jgi:hypothetical protein